MSTQNFEQIVLDKLTNLETVIKTEISELKSDVSELKSDVSGLKLEVSSLNSKFTIMDKKINGLYDRCDDIEGAVNLNTKYINQAFSSISEVNFAKPNYNSRFVV